MIGEIAEFASLLLHRRWSAERTRAHRDERIRTLVAHAYENVPYYRRMMDARGLKPQQIRSARDLEALPVTTKKDLRAAGTDCVDPRATDLYRVATSGSSGEPFEQILTQAEYRRRRLREFRSLIGVGLKPLDRLAVLGPVRTRPRRLHRSLGLYRIEVIPFDARPEEQARRIERACPDVLWIYSTVLKQVLSHTGGRLSDLARPRLLISSSQVLDSPFRQQLLDDLPGARIAELYGSAEAGRIAAGCREDDGLHLEDDAVHVELLEGGRRVEEGEEGTTVITCLDQWAMPLIRYEQGDRCRMRPGRCRCGRSSPLMDSPLGRCADMITLPSGRRLSALAFDAVVRQVPGLVQYRFVQRRRDRLEAQFCFQTPPPAGVLEEIAGRVREVLREQVEVSVGLFGVEEIRGPKFKSVVSLLEEEATGPGPE